jgi:hypothetical protein
MKNIPAGYQLHVTSWENDADNYQSKIVSGLTEEDVKFYLHFLRHFYSDWCTGKIGPGFGNKETRECPEAEKIAVESAYEYCKPTSKKLLEKVEELIETWKTNPTTESSDFFLIEETIDYWGWDWGATAYRVFDSFQVYYIPKQLIDVTKEFSK